MTPELELKQMLFVNMKASPNKLPWNRPKKAGFNKSYAVYSPTCQKSARLSRAENMPLNSIAFRDLGFLKRYWAFLPKIAAN